MGELLGVTIRLDRASWKKLRTLAALRGITAASLLRAFVETLLEKEQAPSRPEQPFRAKRNFIATQSPVMGGKDPAASLATRVPEDMQEDVSRAVFEHNSARDKLHSPEMSISSFLREAIEMKLDAMEKEPGKDLRKR